MTPRTLRLPATPASARKARAWLTAQLDDWSADALDTAQLLVSELVTNAVLHTDEQIEVQVDRAGPTVTVGVLDRNPLKPVIKDYAANAATGRGLHLVSTLADAWGVDEERDQKVVWFELADHNAPSAVSPPGDRGDHPGDDDQGRPGAAGPVLASDAADTALVELHLLGIPVSTYLAAEEHHDALMRELAYLAVAHEVSPSLRELATDVVQHFEPRSEGMRGQVQSARERGDLTVDITMFLPRQGWEAALALATQLDEADRFCEDAQLLTPPTPPPVARFRRWYTDEIARQMHGQAPQPWPDPIANAAMEPSSDGGGIP